MLPHIVQATQPLDALPVVNLLGGGLHSLFLLLSGPIHLSLGIALEQEGSARLWFSPPRLLNSCILGNVGNGDPNVRSCNTFVWCAGVILVDLWNLQCALLLF